MGLGKLARAAARLAFTIIAFPVLVAWLLLLDACGHEAPPAADAGPCECEAALCRSDGTCWCPTDAGTERCEVTP